VVAAKIWSVISLIRYSSLAVLITGWQFRRIHRPDAETDMPSREAVGQPLTHPCPSASACMTMAQIARAAVSAKSVFNSKNGQTISCRHLLTVAVM
jgi:hypothetical protein